MRSEEQSRAARLAPCQCIDYKAISADQDTRYHLLAFSSRRGPCSFRGAKTYPGILLALNGQVKQTLPSLKAILCSSHNLIVSFK